MPRYFFHLHTESRSSRTSRGQCLHLLKKRSPTLGRPRAEYMRDQGIEGGRQQRRCRFEITDKSRTLATVPTGDN